MDVLKKVVGFLFLCIVLTGGTFYVLKQYDQFSQQNDEHKISACNDLKEDNCTWKRMYGVDENK